jgi:hypothetical protein
MNRTLRLTATAATVLLALTACSSSTKTSTDAAPSTAATNSSSTAAATAAPAGNLDASQDMAILARDVRTAHEDLVLTDTTDPNHLMGRPNEYTSDVRFTDSRVLASDTANQGLKTGDVQFGGSIEVFPTAADAATRAKYIQTVTQALPAAAEYDFVSGNVLIRVSHYLTPAQAADYQHAVKSIG